MRYVTTAMLVILTLVMGVYAAVQKEPRKEKAAGEKRVFPEFDPKKAKAVVWTRGKQEVRLEKRGKRWFIASPQEFPAADDTVEALLTDFETLVYSKKLKKDIKRAEYKLSPAKITVTVEGALPNDRKATLRLGGLDLTQRNVYVARGRENDVLLVGEHIRNTVDKSLDEIRDKHAFLFELSEVTGLLTVRQRGDEIRIRKNGKTDVDVLVDSKGAVQVRAHKETVDAILRKLESLKMSRFVEAGEGVLAKHSLLGVARRVKVNLKGKKDQELLIGGRCKVEDKAYVGELMVGRKAPAPAVFCLSAKRLRKIMRPREELRAIKLLDVEADELREIVIRKGGAQVQLTKEKGEWVLAPSKTGDQKDEKRESDAALVARFIDDIQAFRVLGFAFPDKEQLGDYGLAQPQATITLKTGSGESRVLEMGSETEKHLHVRRKGESGVLFVHREISSRFHPDRLAFRDRTVLHFDTLNLKRIEAKREGGVFESAKKIDGSWRLQKPLKIEADSTNIDALVQAASGLKAERYLSASVKPEYGLRGPKAHNLRFKVESEPTFGPDGKKEKGSGAAVWHELVVGPPMEGGGCYGKLLSGDGLVFRLDKLTCSDLRSLLVTRDLLEFTATAVTQLTYRGPKVTEELEKRGPQWHRKAGPKVDNTLVEPLLSALARARAEEVVAYGSPGGRHGAKKPHVSLTVKSGKGEPLTLVVGARTEKGALGGGRYCWVLERNVVYLLSDSTVKDLEQTGF